MRMLPRSTADLLAKLLPRLASDHDGEVIATAAAIGRTLAAAERDWHDIAACVSFWARPKVDAAAHSEPPTAKPQPTDAEMAEAVRQQAEAEAKKRRPAWPTWSSLNRFAMVEWLEAIEATPEAMRLTTAEVFSAFKNKIVRRPHERFEIRKRNLLNRLLKAAWLAHHETAREAA